MVTNKNLIHKALCVPEKDQDGLVPEKFFLIPIEMEKRKLDMENNPKNKKKD